MRGEKNPITLGRSTSFEVQSSTPRIPAASSTAAAEAAARGLWPVLDVDTDLDAVALTAGRGNAEIVDAVEREDRHALDGLGQRDRRSGPR